MRRTIFQKNRWLSRSKLIVLEILLHHFANQGLDEAWKWLERLLKDHVEPIRGKYKRNEIEWRKEAMLMLKYLLPDPNVALFEYPTYLLVLTPCRSDIFFLD